MPNFLTTEGNLLVEIVLRAILAVVFVELEGATPFTRKIHPDELWLYKNPRIDSIVPTTILWPLVFITPTLVIFSVFILQRNRADACKAVLSLSLGLCLTAVLTNIIKLIVGRPRPDFFWRCFPDGIINSEMKCTGELAVIIEGRKSFPSGHSSFSFASMGFIALYVAGKLHIFNSRGRGSSWRLCSALVPLVIAMGVALSRTCDYHHHWEDVLCGSALGLGLAYLCYRQYFPCLSSHHCHRPYSAISPQSDLEAVRSAQADEQVKWI